MEEVDFDVVVIGTGLHESMVAASFARHGKKVLHMDSSNIYGGSYKSITGREFTAWKHSCEAKSEASDENKDNKDGDVNNNNNENIGIDDSKVEFESDVEWIPAGHGEPSLFGNVTTSGDVPEPSREYVVDTTSEVAFCRGPFVDSLVKSGVSHYLEFKAVDSAHIAMNTDISRSKSKSKSKSSKSKSSKSKFKPSLSSSSSVSDSDSSKAADLRRVPCSKADVFRTGSLSLIEKRILMKFLAGGDVGLATKQNAEEDNAGENDNDNVNENENENETEKVSEKEKKAEDDDDVDDDEKNRISDDKNVNSYSRDCDAALDAEFTTFGVFLREKYKFSEKLVDIAGCAIALEPQGADFCTPSHGLIGTRRYLSALGRYGTTAFLASYYGTGEWPQAYCRLAAVQGGVYVLGRKLSAFAVSENGTENGNENENDNGKGMVGRRSIVGLRSEDGDVFVKTRCVVSGAEHLPEAWLRSPDKDLETESEHKAIARAVVFTEDSIAAPEGSEGEISTVVIPAGRFDNESPVYVTQVGSQCGVAPVGIQAVHFTTEIAHNASPQESLSAVINAILPIKTNADNNNNSNNNSSNDSNGGDSDRHKWTVYFTHSALSSGSLGSSQDSPSNLVVIRRPHRASATVDHVVSEASAVFSEAAKVSGIPLAEFLARPERTHEDAMLEAELADEIEEVTKKRDPQADDGSQGCDQGNQADEGIECENGVDKETE